MLQLFSFHFPQLIWKPSRLLKSRKLLQFLQILLTNKSKPTTNFTTAKVAAHDWYAVKVILLGLLCENAILQITIYHLNKKVKFVMPAALLTSYRLHLSYKLTWLLHCHSMCITRSCIPQINLYHHIKATAVCNKIIINFVSPLPLL